MGGRDGEKRRKVIVLSMSLYSDRPDKMTSQVYTSLVGVYSVLENIISFLLDTSTSSHCILLTNWHYLKERRD